MNITYNLKRAMQVAWRYRATWIFGFFLAVTMNNALWLGFLQGDEEIVLKNRLVLTNKYVIYFPGEGLTVDFRDPGFPEIDIGGLDPDWYLDLPVEIEPGDVQRLLISIGILIVISSILVLIFRYTSKAALIRMVDESEQKDQMVGIRRGFHLGWSRVAFKLFMIDVGYLLPVTLIIGLSFLAALSPLFLFGLDRISGSVISIIGILLFVTAGLMLTTLFVLFTLGLTSITRQVMHQACAVDNLGVFPSIRHGFWLVKNCFKEVISTWVAWIVVRLTWIIVSIPLFILLLPILLGMLLLGIITGAVVTGIIAGFATLFVSDLFALAIGILFAFPVLAVITFIPINFFNGLVAVLTTSFWTLSYRGIRESGNTVMEEVRERESTRFDPSIVSTSHNQDQS